MKYLALVLIGLLALGVFAPAYAVTAGITLDVHQDVQVTDPLLLPNDFHVEGKICSKIGSPVLTSHVDDLFAPPAGSFSYTITKVVPADPTDCWYTFKGDWSLATGSPGIPYCTVIHLGLVFDVQAANVVINLVGWWTHDGVQIGDVIQGNNFVNGGYVPVTGFDVGNDSAGRGQTVRITNGIQPNPQFPPLKPPSPNIPIEIVALDLVAFPAGQQIPIDALKENGAQQNWPWIHAVNANGAPIGPDNPAPLTAAASFFDVFLEMQVAGSPGLPPGQQFTIPPGGSLVVRTLMRFTNNSGVTETKWQWDIHGQPSATPCLWNPNDPAKWVQMPDVSPTGMDIRVDSADNNSRILADDFQCTQTGPITDVHFWGSWLNDLKGDIDRLTIGLYSNIPDPDGTGPLFSKPGSLLWQQIFAPSQFSEKLFATLTGNQHEWFWDPFGTITPNPNGDQQVWQYDICIDPANAYVQQGTAANPMIYWLAIQVHLKANGVNAQFGWKTRDPIATHYGGGHFMDDAVFGPVTTWTDLHYPSVPAPGHPLAGQSLDMAFVITSETTPPPCCLQVTYGGAQPADHTFNCALGANPPPNFMQHVKICNPCSTSQPIYGIELQSGGTGNPASVSQVQVFIDADCNGIPDSANPVLSGSFSGSGNLSLCSTSGPIATLAPPGAAGNCVCLIICYKMNCPPAPGTYFFDLVNILGSNCLSICANTTDAAGTWVPLSGAPLHSAVKTVPDCCLTIDKGPLSPPNHVHSCNPLTGNPPNFMSQVKICNPCNTDLPVNGLVLQASGTGNDGPGGVQQVIVYMDRDCDGKPDTTPPTPLLTGSYTADNGTLTLCDPSAQFYLSPGGCICLLIYYQMDCNAPVGTYYFNVVSLLSGPNCLPICANTHDSSGTVVPLASAPIQSAIKTIENCCPTIVKGSHFPPDHNYVCNAATPQEPNFMAEYKLCNPCATEQCYYGLRLVAGGTGNDMTRVQSVMVSLDWNCDGKPETTNVLSGAYPADNGTLDLCTTGGSLCLAPGQCVCIRVYYIMKCDAPAGTYYFDLMALLGPNCQPIQCVQGLPIRSATKTVLPQDCCLDVGYGATHPADHTFTCPPVGTDPPLNKMMNARICNPCPTSMPIYGFNLQAFGSGNDLTDIANVYVAPDMNCDGQDDSPPVPMGTYSADNGTLNYCQAAGPILTLPPTTSTGPSCGCVNIYYRMKCPSTVLGTYLFTLNGILGPNCQPICVKPGQLPLRSAVKTTTTSTQPCCLNVTVGTNNPPSHNWWPGLPLRNRMFTFKICNPCNVPANITCLKLKASGTGNDLNDIAAVRIIRDDSTSLGCNGLVDPGELPFGNVGPYSADNGTFTATPTGGSYIIPAGACRCFVVEYIMKNSPVPAPALDATYCMTLTGVCASTTTTPTTPICVNGLPLNSNCKHRCIKIGPIPHFPPGIVLCLQHKVITAIFQDRFYVQDQYGDSPESDPDAYGPSPDRSAGIAIIGSVPSGTPLGQVVNIEGSTDVVNCEVVVRSTSIELLPDPLVQVKPMGVNNKNSAGGTKGFQPAVVDNFVDVFFSVQTNNVGLLMTAWGMVTDSDPERNMFWIDDGSGLKDGSFSASGQPHVGVKVNATYAGWTPPIGSYVAVTGIVRAEDYFGKCIRVMYARYHDSVMIVPSF